ncbi:CSEP0031 putative effector protein [Blumeria hordei DH14]|uniref:CSEP0031 putative effector protein n=1 Tax=Blumeria graminis f. sp. hordei (strain DH14) TaxID=546991 RepID=N1JER8_BLUG1|nr:CSEP0031 putative effector protein [Blumeria hordei DH14]
MRFSNLAIIIYAARFISAASNYKTAHIEEERKGFICDGEYLSESKFRADRYQGQKDLKESKDNLIGAGELKELFESQQPDRLMMYDNGDAKEHYSWLIPSLERESSRKSIC